VFANPVVLGRCDVLPPDACPPPPPRALWMAGGRALLAWLAGCVWAAGLCAAAPTPHPAAPRPLTAVPRRASSFHHGVLLRRALRAGAPLGGEGGSLTQHKCTGAGHFISSPPPSGSPWLPRLAPPPPGQVQCEEMNDGRPRPPVPRRRPPDRGIPAAAAHSGGRLSASGLFVPSAALWPLRSIRRFIHSYLHRIRQDFSRSGL